MTRVGHRALVTGGASGLGLAIARQLVADGAQVVIADISDDAIAPALEQLGQDAIGITCDVRSADQVRAMTAAAVAELGGLDILVLSAGVIHIKPLADVTEADWDGTLDVNLKGAFLVIQATAPYLVESSAGRIVAISSDAGKRGFAWISAYSASKFGLIGLVESIAVELAPHGVTVNAVCPVGATTTGMGKQVLDWKVKTSGRTPTEVAAAAAATNPLGRNAGEADVVAAVRFLVSEDAGFITGVALDVDGGAHLGFLPGATS